MEPYWLIEQSGPLEGSVEVDGAKNAVLVIMASLLLTRGISYLYDVPASSDVYHMCHLLEQLGARTWFYTQAQTLVVDTEHVCSTSISADIMQKMRASILVMGPLLARMGRAEVAMPGGCVIGARPVDMHMQAFEKLGVEITTQREHIQAVALNPQARRIVLDYPSVGATENTLMYAVAVPGTTYVINAALEPEVLNHIAALQQMGARITIQAPATITIEGGASLSPIQHTIIPDRIEAGTLLLAAAATGGSITIPNAPAHSMDAFLEKLRHVGHVVEVGSDGVGVVLSSGYKLQPVSIRTTPYPGFPTDLQAPMMAMLACVPGKSTVWETVYENRMLHVQELAKFGAQIQAERMHAHIYGVSYMHGASVVAPDIRGGAALVIAGLMASGVTTIGGIHHMQRGHGDLWRKLRHLGAHITPYEDSSLPTEAHWSSQQVPV